MPESDPLPEPRNIADLFPAVLGTVTIMLALAPRCPQGANTLTPGIAASLSQENGGGPAVFSPDFLSTLKCVAPVTR